MKKLILLVDDDEDELLLQQCRRKFAARRSTWVLRTVWRKQGVCPSWHSKSQCCFTKRMLHRNLSDKHFNAGDGDRNSILATVKSKFTAVLNLFRNTLPASEDASTRMALLIQYSYLVKSYAYNVNEYSLLFLAFFNPDISKCLAFLPRFNDRQRTHFSEAAIKPTTHVRQLIHHFLRCTCILVIFTPSHIVPATATAIVDTYLIVKKT